MIERVIVLLALLLAGLHIPATVVALGAGNWGLGLLYGGLVLFFLVAAVVYAAMAVSGKEDDD
jgi:hypothetical protein